MKTLLTLGLLLAAAPLSLHAQSYVGDYHYSIHADGDPSHDGTISTGPDHEVLVETGQRASIGDGCSGTASVSSIVVERFALPGGFRSSSHVQGTQLIASPCGSDAGGHGRMNQGIDADDLIFRRVSDPLATGTISVSLNVEFSGRAEPPQVSCGGFVSRYFISAGAGNYPHKLLSKYGTLDGSGSYGPLAGYPNDDSIVTFTTSPIGGIDLLVPEPLHLGLEVNARAGLCEDPTPDWMDFETHAWLSLPRSGPVFDLPPDVTVDSVQLGIVDNHWTGWKRLRVSVSPNPVVAGADLVLTAWNGRPGRRVAFYLVALNGAPMHRLLRPVGRLDASGRWESAPLATRPEWAGLTGQIQAASMSADGHLFLSDPVTVAFQ